jgi:hypothetical protein
MLTGGCYCKAIRYQAEDHTLNRTNCHCAMCRGTTGAPCVAWFTVSAADFRFTSGNPTLYRSSQHATRAFCAVCGTQLTFSDDASLDEVDITTCSLDVSTGVEPQDHTFTGSQVPWLKLNDGLPRYPRSRSEG